MSEDKDKKEINTDWSLKELNEAEKSNLLGFFSLLLEVDRRVNPQLYANIRNTNHTDKTK